MHTVKWFQILLYNSHNLTSIICLHTVCAIRPIDRTMSGATTPSQRGPGSNGNEGVLYIPQISKAEASLSDVLMSYPGHSWREGSYPSAEMQSVYSTAPANWAIFDPWFESYQIQLFWLRVDLGVIALKGYITLCRSPELEPRHQIQFCVLLRTPFVLHPAYAEYLSKYI